MSLLAPWATVSGYSFEPGVWVPVMLSALLYWRGQHHVALVRGAAGRRSRRWRAAAFTSGLFVVLLALESPIDLLAERLFWMHMVEHCLLQVVAAPLIVAGAPWLPVWHGLPLRWRRALAPRGLRLVQRRAVRAVARTLRQPSVCIGLFALTFWVWHVPTLFDATLANQALHDVEHATFLAAGLLYWSQTMDSLPLRRTLGTWWLIGYLVGGAASMWVVAVILGFASHPLYAPYAALATRPGGISALTDQQWGAGVAWVPSSMPFEVMLDIIVIRWLVEDERRADAAVAAADPTRSAP